MKYLEFLWATDWLSRYHPKYCASELMLLAEDVLKWFDEELPEDSSTLIYLKSLYRSPDEALQDISEEIQLLTGPTSIN
jgi:DNA-directed RNA polymerase beta' subunit